MSGMMRVPRSRGALSGVLLVLLGAWGGLIPFVGPHFHYAYTPDSTWAYTSGRLLLEVLPGAATVLGGLIVLASKFRPAVFLGAWLAALSGAWFVVGGILSVLWAKDGAATAGSPVGGTAARVAEQIGFFAGLGVVIVFLAALALGRFTVIGIRETKIAEREKEIAAEERLAPAAASPAADARTSPETGTVADERIPVASDERIPVASDESTPARVSTPAEVSTPADAEKTTEEAGEDEPETPGKVKVTS
jgi:hypothetical protein